MVNFHDPKVIAREYVALVNFIHCHDGVFIWEFLISLKFDWEHMSGRRKFRWIYVLYTLSRLGGLGTAICNFIGLDATREINCQLWLTWTLILGFTGFACASLLMALRVIAIWDMNRIVTAVVIGMSLTNIGFLIYGIVAAHARRSAEGSTCLLSSTHTSQSNVTVTVVTDIALLILMLVGLSRSRQRKYGIVRYLWVQGLIWLIAATVAEIPAAVFINLNLNVMWNMMFQEFALYTMVICATRMYRALIDNEVEGHTVKNTGDAPVTSQLRFGRMPHTGTSTGTTGSTTANQKSRSDTTDNHFGDVDVELSLTEKAVPVGDEEA